MSGASIKLDLDTTGAKASLDALDSRISQSSRVAQRGYGGGGGGGLLSQIMNMSAGGLGLASMAGMVGAPIARDAGTVAQGIFGGVGEMATGAIGLRGWANNIGADEQAKQQTIQALGPAAAGMSETKIREVFDAFQRIASMNAAGKTAVESAVSVPMTADAIAPIVSGLEDVVKAIKGLGAPPRASTGAGGAMPGAGR